MKPSEINWSKQICGVRQASAQDVVKYMPDLQELLGTFPDDVNNFSWDVKVHMLFPRQYPCIPHWHTDNVPRENGIQRFDQVKLHLPMYLWLSGAPLTQFKHGYLQPQKWHRFNQADEHRGTASGDNCWRGFVRATHREIVDVSTDPNVVLRRHSQVYLDADTYQW